MSNTHSIQQNDEKLILAINDHWILLVRPFVALIVGWIIFSLLAYAANTVETSAPGVGIGIIIFGIVGLVMVQHCFFIYFLHWILSSIYITNRRIIEVNVTAYVCNDVTFFDLHKFYRIQKVRHGIWQNILNYGTVIASISGLHDTVPFKYIPNPGKLVNFLEAYLQGHFKDMTPVEMRKLFASKSAPFYHHTAS